MILNYIVVRQDTVITLFPTSYGSQLLCNSCIRLGDKKQLVSVVRFLSAYMSYNSEAYSSCFVSSINMCKGIVVDGFEVSETDIWNTCCQVSGLLELHICRPNNAVPKFHSIYSVLLKFWLKMRPYMQSARNTLRCKYMPECLEWQHNGFWCFHL